MFPSARNWILRARAIQIEEALANLKEALEGFFETASAEEVRTRLKKPALFTRIEVECA